MSGTKRGESVREQAEAHFVPPWGGLYLGGPPRNDPRSIVGGMMINFGTVEFIPSCCSGYSFQRGKTAANSLSDSFDPGLTPSFLC
jgi:hypothetical protein